VEPAAVLSQPDTVANIFPDPILAADVARQLRVSVDTIVTQEDLNKIDSLLFADFLGIYSPQNLQGIQFLTLTFLSLSVFETSDLSLLAGLVSLEELHLRGVSDLSPLAGLINLRVLRLAGNAISDLSPLADLTDLVILDLGDNEISDLAPLAGLTDLVTLHLWDNEISDLGPLAGLTDLVILDLGNNEISDLNPLAGVPALTRLSLGNNQISDLSPLAGLTNLIGLDLKWNEISDLRPLAGLAAKVLATNQQITLAPVPHINPLVVENNIFNIDGTRVVPTQISNGGTYAAPNVTWAGLPAGTSEVTYAFDEDIAFFSGTVIQPIADAVDTQPPPALPFTDVPATAWFHDAVAFVYNEGIMRGASETTFDPMADFNREQVVATLFRMYHGRSANTDDPTSTPFADVDPGGWYAPYIAWAFEHGIVTGQTETIFGTGDPVTRQDFAVLTHRLANLMGADTSVPDGFTIHQFPDAGTIGAWAQDAMAWAVYAGLFTGTDEGLLNPWNTAIRAEAATILMRYVQTVAE